MSSHFLLLHALILVPLAAPGPAADYPRHELLIEPTALARPDAASTYVILDARERTQYDAGHVPGALWVNAAEWAKEFGDGEDVVGWTRRLGTLGLKLDSRAVVYDDNLSKDAARLWWILQYWGFTDVRILNGGWKGWQVAKLPVASDVPASPRPTEPRLLPAAERLATKAELLAALSTSALQIIDSRSEGEFCGTAPLPAKKKGAIPGAKHLEWSDLLDKDSQRFKSADELMKLFDAAGIDLEKPTAAHCQSGGRSSVMAFGLELMGAKDVSNYYRSWAEWGNADDTPVAPGKKKQ